MLTHIHIRDLAIVEALELELASGLTVLSGETGAGKSIIVDALMLASGARADSSQIRAGAARAEVSASFDIRQVPIVLRELLDEAGIDATDELLLRRVINADGRSRAFANGQALPLQQLREIAGHLLEVHGQHEFQSLARPVAQRELLDKYGKHEALLQNVAEACARWQALERDLQQIESRLRDRDARLDLLRFQESELAALDLRPGEVESLLGESTRLANGERLLAGAQLAAQHLYESDGASAQASVARAQAALRPLAVIDDKLAAILPLLDEAAIRIGEAARELSRYAESVDLDHARQAQVEKRLAAAEELARKHRLEPAALPAQREALGAEIAALEAAGADAAGLRQQRDEALRAWRALAADLSEARAASAATFNREITARMQQLGMANGRFEATVAPQPAQSPLPHGRDEVEFLVTANAGQPLAPLARVASGGELSRLSLAVQVACVADEKRCMVFDEVDAGIGGAIAEVVGRQLRRLGSQGQVLCVTHLPQVASQGHQQLRVTKSSNGGQTRTRVARLGSDERVEEIARMLGGAAVTGTAREHAREMLGEAQSKDRDTVRIKRPRIRAAQP